ncbi:ArnT family glycosyltransferase, partial [Enterococcus faecium]
FYTIIILCVITYLLAMFMTPLMDVDASQYASISREMLERKSFLQIYDQGADYLDKPPLLFWLSAASMYVLGIHDWAYRLPSIIMLLVAIL